MAEREDVRERVPDETASDDLEGESLGLSGFDSGSKTVDVDLAALETESAADAAGADDSGSRFSLGLTERLRSRVSSWFSTGSFLVAAALSVIGVFVLGGLLPFGGIGDLTGIAMASFGYGLLSDESHYLENGVAGALVAGTWSLVGNLVVTLLGLGLPVVALGFAGGGIAGIVGHYFGRDLRDGLTRDV
jgi:hypothetical protein